MIGVALIFFEHGKRVAMKPEQAGPSKLELGRMDQEVITIELVETNPTPQKEIEKKIIEEPSTPLLLNKKPKLTVELDGEDTNRVTTIIASNSEEDRKKKILSMRSIYELG
jgi:hypothetical protein